MSYPVPLEGVKITPMPQTPIPTPNVLELNRLLKAIRELHNPRLHKNTKYETPKERAFFTARNMAFYVGLVATCCRVGELIDLPMEQVNVKDLTFTFIKTKTHKRRTVPFDDAENLLYLPLLQKYLALRPKVDTDKVNGESLGSMKRCGPHGDEPDIMPNCRNSPFIVLGTTP